MVASMRPDLLNVVNFLIELGANVNPYRPDHMLGPHCTMLPRKGLSRLSIYFYHMEVYDRLYMAPCFILFASLYLYVKNIFCYILEANPFITNDDCNTALELAIEKGYVNVVQAIEGNRRSAGFTNEERKSFVTNFLSKGFVDTFRKQHPNVVAYCYWGYRHNGRKTNKGWRLDYFLVSESIAERVHDSYILPDISASDHSPLGLILKL